MQTSGYKRCPLRLSTSLVSVAKRYAMENGTSIENSCYSLDILFVDRLRFSVRSRLVIHDLKKFHSNTLLGRSSGLKTRSTVNDGKAHQAICWTNHPAFDPVIWDVHEIVDQRTCIHGVFLEVRERHPSRPVFHYTQGPVSRSCVILPCRKRTDWDEVDE